MAVKELFAQNTLTLTSGLDTNIKWKSLRQRLRMTSDVKQNISVQEVASRLWFQHVATATKILNLVAGNVLSFYETTVPREYLLNVPTGLPIWHEVEVTNSKTLQNKIIFNSNAIFDVVHYNPADIITITDSAIFQIIKVIQIMDVLSLRQGVSVYKESKYFYAV